jgi:mannose-6-phosphate isomerase-like protein (cupin superfamily)
VRKRGGKKSGRPKAPNTLHNCCVALARSSALVPPLVSGYTSGTLAFADANANVSCSETLDAMAVDQEKMEKKHKYKGEYIMEIEVVNLNEKFNKITELHKYKIVAQMNTYYFKLVKMKREFIWHSHQETDETFIVLKGELIIELRDRQLILKDGDLVVIPKGIEHKPKSIIETEILLIEPKETINTGRTNSELTDAELEWI